MSRQIDTHMATARALQSADKRELTSLQIAVVELAKEVVRLRAVADLMARHDKALS